MHEYELVEGEGISGPFSQVAASTTAMFSCYAFVFDNRQTSIAGMYHYPACALGKPTVQSTIIQMINDIQPQILHVVPGGTFGEVEVAGGAGVRKQDVHPLYRAKADADLIGVTGAADAARIQRMKPAMSPVHMHQEATLQDYDKVKAFLQDKKGPQCILKIYPAALGAWYRAEGGGVRVNHNQDAFAGRRDGIDELSRSMVTTAREVLRVAQGNVHYYGGKV